MHGGDTALVLRARQGARAAFAAHYARHRPLLTRVCARVLGAGLAAEDVVQEAVLQALLHLDCPERPERFGPWLAGCGLKLAYRAHRAYRARRGGWSWEALVGGGLVREPVDGRPGPAETAETAELGGLGGRGGERAASGAAGGRSSGPPVGAEPR